MSEQNENTEIKVVPVDKAKIRKIWMIGLVMVIITIAEYLVAYNIPAEYKWVRIVLFLLMTLAKAYYIVSEFMHLGHENKTLIYSILIPMILLVWMLAAFLIESGSAG